MKTKIINTQTIPLKLFSIILLVVAMQACVSPVDVEDPNGKTIIDPPPFQPAPLIKPKEVVLNLIHDNTIQPLNPNDFSIPLWTNNVIESILIDTNKVNQRNMPRVILKFTASSSKLNPPRQREGQNFLLKQIFLSIEDTIDLVNDEEIIYTKKDLSPNDNFLIYTYTNQKIQEDIRVDYDTNSRCIVRFEKIENRNRIRVIFSYSVFSKATGTNIPNGVRLFGRGELIINY